MPFKRLTNPIVWDIAVAKVSKPIGPLLRLGTNSSFAVSTQSQKSIDYHHGEMISRQGDYYIGSWADESHHESFAVDTALPEMQSDENFLDTQTGAEDPPSIVDAAAPSINGHFGSRQITLHQNKKRTPCWENTERLDDIYYPFDNSISWLKTRTNEIKQDMAILQKQHAVDAGRSKSIATHAQPSIDAHIQASIDARLTSFEDRLQSFTYRLDGVYYPLCDSVDSLTTRLDSVQQEMDMIQRQLNSQTAPSPSIDRRTRPSIDGDYAAPRNKMVTEKSLHDKLDEITFSQDLLKENVYQKLKDISESTYARLGMQLRSIGNFQHRMHASEMSKDEVDTCTQPSGHFDHY
ncbi:hypothetical protein F2Q69_00036301 [Brassica cretica]|uniref:Uncharacterized protein n=2 Tax=Brassica cretica TaxID=69181 RepID=A0A8S9SPW9_BRACR|nr:hypothetical protein F2Q69_00036301 [Brassica cretica]